MSEERLPWEKAPKGEQSAFGKGFQGCLGVGCAIFVLLFGGMFLLASCGTLFG